jgi:ABC-2 type transport system ATP-binding protein
VSAAPGIVAEGLTKVYVDHRRRLFRSERIEVPAVVGLDLQVRPGEVTGLLGLNGAGKTTTIKMLSTLLLPTAGTATVDGLDLVREARAIRRVINMVAGGERMVYWRLTGRENLWYFAQLYDVPRAGLKDRIDGLLRLVGLSDAADMAVERYSKGMKQRLQLARGLINEPRYLFLDEPTIGLDAPIAREMRRMVSQMAADGRGVLLTSHYLQEVDELCSHVYLIHRGRLIAEGSPAELKALAGQERSVSVLLSELPDPVASALRGLAAETGAGLETGATAEGIRVTLRHRDDLSGRIASTVALSGTPIIRLESLEPTLENAVMALTEKVGGDARG